VVILPGKFDMPGYESMGGNEHIGIYRNPRALSGATILPGLVVEPDSARQVARLWDPAFSPADSALVFAPVPGLEHAGGKGTATIESDGADSVTVRATVNGPALLLLSRNWHPSWQATVDGEAVPVVRTDYSLLGVPLAHAGDHHVTLSYRPAIVATARRVSFAAWALVLLASLVAAGASWKRERRDA
jgi:hypothetical protein